MQCETSSASDELALDGYRTHERKKPRTCNKGSVRTAKEMETERAHEGSEKGDDRKRRRDRRGEHNDGSKQQKWS